MRKIYFILALLSISIFITCKRDNTAEISSEAPANDTETVFASINGVVLDENNIPLPRVQVQCGASSTTSDAYGNFSFLNIVVSKNNATVKIVRNGYFTAYRTFVAVSDRVHYVKIKLIKKNNTGSFNGASGGTVTLPSGAKIVIPANSIADANGNTFLGQVNVAMTWIDPADTNTLNLIPGDLRGINKIGMERSLESYGKIGVELTSSAGQLLNLAAGKTCELTLPVSGISSGNAPATISLWYFDETKNRWVEEGVAQKMGNNYVGTVSHFSFWDFVLAFPTVNLCMKLQNSSGQPLSNTLVILRRTSSNLIYPASFGYTDQLGNLCGLVPKNEPLILEVRPSGPCSNVIFTQNIGPFSANASLGTVTVSMSSGSWLIITGTAQNCSGNPVISGTAFISVNGSYYLTAPVENGNFSAILFNCTNNVQTYSVVVADRSTGLQSLPVNGSGTGGTVNTGPLSACGFSTSEYVIVLINGIQYSWGVAPSQVYNITCITNPVGGGQYRTGLDARSGVPSTTFSFFHNATIGSFPLDYTFVEVAEPSGFVSANTTITVNPQINIIEMGPQSTGFIAGNFNIQMIFNGTPPTVRNVSCQFRARRQ